MSDNAQVVLGRHTVNVYPQRHAYLTNKFGKFVQGLTEVGSVEVTDASSAASLLGDKTYYLLEVLIPQYTRDCPFYEYMGYGSQKAYDERDYDEEKDNSPDFPSIVGAMETAIKVNRFDVFKILKQLIDPELAKAWVNEQIADLILNSGPAISPAPKAGSATPKRSSTPARRSTAKKASASPASKASKPRTKRSSAQTSPS